MHNIYPYGTNYHDLAYTAGNERGRGAITAHSNHLYVCKYKSFLFSMVRLK